MLYDFLCIVSVFCVKEARSIIFQIIVISCKQNVYHFSVNAVSMLKLKGGKLVNREAGA